MPDLAQRKYYSQLHAIAQGMDMQVFAKVLDSITNDAGIYPGDWCMTLTAKADQYYAQHQYEPALHYYNLARFPYIDSPAKQRAYACCKKAFAQCCRRQQLSLETLSIRCEGMDVPCYFSPGPRLDAPLFFVMGGVVSIKEQWIQLLKLGKRLKSAVVLIDFPGVGDNPLSYHRHSHYLLKRVLDRLRRYANVTNTHCVAMSFGGSLALQHAAHDARIRSVITVGAPIHDFFVDHTHWASVPEITKQCLQHCLKRDITQLSNGLSLLSIREQIKQLHIPVCYVFSERDELIVSAEKDNLLRHCQNLALYCFDDVHGSPNHLPLTKLIIIGNLLKWMRKKRLIPALIQLKLKWQQLKTGFSMISQDHKV